MKDFDSGYITQAAKDLIGALWHEARVEKMYKIAQMHLDRYRSWEGAKNEESPRGEQDEGQQALEGHRSRLRADVDCPCGWCSPQI